jgi:hypothetical protein
MLQSTCRSVQPKQHDGNPPQQHSTGRRYREARCSTQQQQKIAKLCQMATASKCKDSVSDFLFDVMALGRYIGPCLSKYAQTTQDKVDYHSGTTVIKAFIANNFIFYNDRKRIIKELNEDSLQRACFVKITRRIQKNYQNSQSITFAAESDQPEICPVCSAMQLVLRARRLNQPDDIPIVLYKTKRAR